MLHEPAPPTRAPTASADDDLPTPRRSPALPRDLRSLARRAGRDGRAARELATALLARGWDAGDVAARSGLAPEAVAALGTVRRPGTAAQWVADDLAARVRRRAGRTR